MNTLKEAVLAKLIFEESFQGTKLSRIEVDLPSVRRVLKLLKSKRSLTEIAEATGLPISSLSAVRQGLLWKPLTGGPVPCDDLPSPAHRQAKLTEAEARAIYKSAKRGVKHAYLAKKYGVSKHTISSIKNKRSWKHIHKRNRK